MAKEMPPLTVKGFLQPLHAYEVLSLREQLPTKVIRRNVDGMRITIDLGRSDRQKAIVMLKELISEINGGTPAI